MDQSVPQKQQTNKKLVMGWFSFTCCGDSTILFTELLNDHLEEWKKVIEFRSLSILKSKNSMENLDVAFIEGAISSEKQEEEVKKIRENSKYVVAIGACAVTGMPAASRNEFTEDQINERIGWYMSHFEYNDKVRKLDEVIKIDDAVPGCPMDVPTFYKMLEKYLKILNIT